MSTVGDVGYVDSDGFLHLTDRATFMIISGGVNIYPQECENLLITHPKIADAAVFGVPNTDPARRPGRWCSSDARIAACPDLAENLIRLFQKQVTVAPEGAALDRLRGRTAPAADRKTSPRHVLRPLLGRQDLADP